MSWSPGIYTWNELEPIDLTVPIIASSIKKVSTTPLLVRGVSILNVTFEVVLPFEAISSELAPRIWTQVRPLEPMLSLSMANKVLFEGKAPITM